MIRLDLEKLDEMLLKTPNNVDKNGYVSEVEVKETMVDNKLTITERVTRSFLPVAEINSARYETILTMFQTLMLYLAEVDDDEKLEGIQTIITKAPINVQCAYDTLDNYGLIIEN